MHYQLDKYIISFKENNLKLGFNAYTIFLHFTFLSIRKLTATTAEITGDFHRLPASNNIPDRVQNAVLKVL
jgi:hypothetical protein